MRLRVQRFDVFACHRKRRWGKSARRVPLRFDVVLGGQKHVEALD